MAHIFNAKTLEKKLVEPKLKEFTWHKSLKLNKLVESDDYIFDVKKIGPGHFSYPYHYHYNSEEIFVILSGVVTLRSPKGFEVLTQGDIVFFEKGPSGSHQLYNHSDQACTYLDIRSQKDLDVCEYPDSDKINIMGDQVQISLKGQTVDYFHGEAEVYKKWHAEGYKFE